MTWALAYACSLLVSVGVLCLIVVGNAIATDVDRGAHIPWGFLTLMIAAAALAMTVGAVGLVGALS